MYPHQADRLSEALERANVNAFVATSPANIAYMTGFYRFPGSDMQSPAFAAFSRAGVALVVSAMEAASVVGELVDVEHVVCFKGAHASWPDGPKQGEAGRRLETVVAAAASGADEAVATALDRVGVRQGSIGLDESRITPEAWTRLAAGLSGLEVVSGAGYLADARRVKGPYEIECVGQALGIAEEALNAVIQAIERGMTERDMATMVTSEIVKRDGWPLPPLVAIGARTGIPAAWSTDSPLRPGDLVRFDVGCRYKGYCASVGRTAVLGEPSARQSALYHAVQAGLDTAASTMRGGVRAGRVFDAAMEALRAHGLPEHGVNHVGHGVGLEPGEAPVLALDSAPILGPGEILAVEAAHWEFGFLGVSVKNTVLITPTDARSLNRSHHGLVVLD